MSWINEKMSNLDEKITATEMELNVLRDQYLDLEEDQTFWQNVEAAGVSCELLDRLYEDDRLTESGLIHELESSIKYYENMYDDSEHEGDKAKLNEIASNIEYYRSLLAAVEDL